MPTYMNFSTLSTDVQNYIERGASPINDPTVFAQIPRMINACERKIAQTLKLQGILTPLIDPNGLVQGNGVVTKPDRWRQTASMFYGAGTGNESYTPLLPRSLEYCRWYWPDDTQEGAPQFYADYDYQHWLIVPTPDADYPLQSNCYLQPELLDTSNQTNFFTDYTPNLLLYGTLLEAMPFLKNDDRIQSWQLYWNTEIQSLIDQDIGKLFDRTAERSRP